MPILIEIDDFVEKINPLKQDCKSLKLLLNSVKLKLDEAVWYGAVKSNIMSYKDPNEDKVQPIDTNKETKDRTGTKSGGGTGGSGGMIDPAVED